MQLLPGLQAQHNASASHGQHIEATHQQHQLKFCVSYVGMYGSGGAEASCEAPNVCPVDCAC